MHTLRSVTILLGLAVSVAACGGDAGQGGTGGQGAMTLTGAGSSFDYPIFSRWFADYGQTNPVRVNYQPIGSGGGIRQFTEGTVDFGATDAPLTAEEQAAVPGAMNLPVILGSVAVTYNVPSVQQALRLSGPVLADIFAGRTTKWNDAAIVQLNPGVQLPNEDILVVHRSDGSGTTFIFSDYLASVSPQWASGPGVGKSLAWPTGLGAKGNEGVSGQVKQSDGAIGYVEQAYAEQNDLPMAQLQNAAGEYVAPSVESTMAAAASIGDLLEQHPDFKLSIVNAPGDGAYPIAAWSYILVHRHMDDCAKAEALIGVFEWSLKNGDDAARQLSYAPLPDDLEATVLDRLHGVTCGPDNRPVGG
jgi:phosphate transport system substrate-binding protein